MQTFDLGFGAELDKLAETPGGEPLTLTNPVRAGWAGAHGPAIVPAAWPRGPKTGLPMMHALTLRLPADYQRRGPEFPAIAFFQGEGQFAEAGPSADANSDDPFLRDLAAARPHSQLRLLEDIIGGAFALIWLTEAEFAGGPVAPPTDVRRPGEHTATDEGPNAWDGGFGDSGFGENTPVIEVWLGERTDPNAGVPPTEDEDTAYQQILFETDDSYDYQPWAEPLAGRSHLGGTTFCVQAVPAGLTPYYLEIEELAGLNFGGGNAQIDLESDTFDWACG